jgi:hypothetical protein
MSWWKEKKESERENVAVIKYDKMIAISVQNWSGIVNQPLEEGLQYRIITKKAFNAISVLRFLLQEYEIIEIHLAIYRMNLPAVDCLKEIISTNKIKSYILLSNFFRENKRYERWSEELATFAKKSIHTKLAYSRNHAKVLTALTACGKKIVFEGSGNLSDNSRLEQYIYEQNKDSYDFHKTWIENEVRINT